MPVAKGRQWIYPAQVVGRYQKAHRKVSLVLFSILLVTPWVQVGGHPVVLIDIAGRRLHALGSIYTPRDAIFLVLMALFAAFSLFLFTSLFGRLWCGYACPQTVFLEELIRPIERRIEGSRGKRMARDRGPMTFDKAWRKIAKWGAFALISAVLAMSMVSWFVDARLLWTAQGSIAAYAMVGVIASVLMADFAWFREQFCNYLCPYARFQGALTDDESLTVAYIVERGEPRLKGKARREAKAAGASVGACIDCGRCVTVCPQGIDIRDGFQMECINCARCVDACTAVMEKLKQDGDGKHTSLVQYTTIAKAEGRESHRIRGRTVLYGALLMALIAAFAGLMMGRHSIDVSVNRAPGTLFIIDDDGAIRNTFLIQVTDRRGGADVADAPLTVWVEGLEEAEVILPASALSAGQVLTIPLVVRVPAAAEVERTVPLTIHVETDFDTVEVQTTFKSSAQES